MLHISKKSAYKHWSVEKIKQKEYQDIQGVPIRYVWNIMILAKIAALDFKKGYWYQIQYVRDVH